MAAPELTVEAVKTVAASQNRASLPSFLQGMYRYLRHVPNSRPIKWQVRIAYGPFAVYQPVEGGPVVFRPIACRHTVDYRVRRWPLAFLRVLHGRLLGRWAGRGHNLENR